MCSLIAMLTLSLVLWSYHNLLHLFFKYEKNDFWSSGPVLNAWECFESLSYTPVVIEDTSISMIGQNVQQVGPVVL